MKPNLANSGRKNAEEAERTRGQILASASELFSTKGFDATSLREIANTAQVTHSTITHHFGAKIDIWYAIAHRNINSYRKQLETKLGQAIRHEVGTLCIFKTAVEVLIDTLLKHPQLVRLMSMEHDTDNKRALFLAAKLSESHHLVSGLFEAAREKEPCLQKYNADTFLVMLLGLISAPALFPILQKTLTQTNINSDDFRAHYKALILSTLFH
ncbi:MULTISPECIES: TetR/AcrR family transcriptional regulator [unclassified Shewanella]|uniref:TetR/AcrR family transcriptional regulator n=1 Tax=unclassified Shewanella TaxID=196818 RepID=UPI0006D678FF|nr:TetR/AcrR family transcriptional regulator [Shewanella sp. P1-14-1]KPZ73427.1 HTH-type transcriptional regulator AcrR [Shewanella sp. P1-14-1]